MTVGERIKKIRKLQGMTLEQFGCKLGVSKVAISLLENDKNNLSEQMATGICREFGTCDKWLRTGEGEMYNKYTDSILGDLVVQYGLDEMDQRLVTEYIRLSADKKEIFKDYLRRVLGDGSTDLHSKFPATAEEFEQMYPPDPPADASDVG